MILWEWDLHGLAGPIEGKYLLIRFVHMDLVKTVILSGLIQPDGFSLLIFLIFVFQDNLLMLRSEKNVTVNVRNDLGQVTSRLTVGESTWLVNHVTDFTTDWPDHRWNSHLLATLG